jgi:TPR repeat protein
MPQTFLRTTKNLLCSCALIGSLAVGQAWSSHISDEEIISPCVAPLVSVARESGVRLNDDFFNHEQNALDNKARKESVLMWLNRPGGDQRQRIQDTRQFPYSALVYFTAQFPRSLKNTSDIGSGTFIEKEVILTAAHVVYSHDKGGYYTTLRCIAAPNEAAAPFGIASIENVKVSPKYIQKGDDYKQYDYALVFLKSGVGEKTGYMGLASLNDGSYGKLQVTIAGYPADKIQDIASPSMWGMTGDLMTITPDELRHNIDTYGGQSGSGMWFHREKDGKSDYYIVGVHAYGTETGQPGAYNHGPRLTRAKAQEIQSWIQAFRDKSLVFEKRDRVAKKTLEGNITELEEQDNLAEHLSSLSLPREEDERIPAELLARAKSGDASSQYEIGLKYTQGKEGVVKDEKKAFYWFSQAFKIYEPAAFAGEAEAQYKLGIMYSLGRVVDKDLDQSRGWYEKSAAQGHPKALYNLGTIYENGKGVEKDGKKALELYEQSAAKGEANALFRLGQIHESGLLGLSKDKAQALDLYKQAANLGHEDAKKRLPKET